MSPRAGTDRAAIRAAIERELQARLRARSRPAVVQLECEACRGRSPADARFCTHCGARFNAIVVSADAPAAARRTDE